VVNKCSYLEWTSCAPPQSICRRRLRRCCTRPPPGPADHFYQSSNAFGNGLDLRTPPTNCGSAPSACGLRYPTCPLTRAGKQTDQGACLVLSHAYQASGSQWPPRTSTQCRLVEMKWWLPHIFGAHCPLQKCLTRDVSLPRLWPSQSVRDSLERSEKFVVNLARLALQIEEDINTNEVWLMGQAFDQLIIS
jgi:hypothetical protein